MLPFVLVTMPIQRGIYLILIDPVPAFGVPEFKIFIPAIVDEGHEFAVGYELIGDLVKLKVHLVPFQLDNIKKTFTGMPYFINARRNVYPLLRLGFYVMFFGMQIIYGH